MLYFPKLIFDIHYQGNGVPPVTHVKEMKTSTSRSDDWYDMDHPQRGQAHIFNHKIFKKRISGEILDSRKGTEKDVNALKKSLATYGWNVTIHNDYKKYQIDKIMTHIAKQNHQLSDSVLIAVLSHGDNRKFSAYDIDYEETDLLWPLRDCPTLAGKPKIFIFQVPIIVMFTLLCLRISYIYAYNIHTYIHVHTIHGQMPLTPILILMFPDLQRSFS